jgi:hypothetical protein
MDNLGELDDRLSDPDDPNELLKRMATMNRPPVRLAG